MHDFGVRDCGVAVIRMSDWWVLLTLRLVLPLSVPAALPCTHLAMHDFGVRDSGVAVIRMSDWWVLLTLRLVLPLSVPAAKFVSGTHLAMHDLLLEPWGEAVIRMRCFLNRLCRSC